MLFNIILDLLRFSKTRELWSSKVNHLHNCIFHCCQSWLRSQATNPDTKETHKMDWNPPITNYKPWPFEPTEVNFCFLRGLLRLLMGAKNANISCLFNFRIRVFLERTVNFYFQFCFKLIIILYHTQKQKKIKFRPRANWTMASILRREWYDVSQALSKAKVILFHVSWNEHGDCLYY